VSKDRVHETEVFLRAVDTLLKSTILSSATRLHVQELRARLETELTDMKKETNGRCA